MCYGSQQQVFRLDPNDASPAMELVDTIKLQFL
jgi:hypothetical protein